VGREQGDRAGEKKGRGRREREREREGEGKTHLRGSKFQRSRLQTLGHYGERERERWKRERDVTAREKSNETNGSRGGRGRAHGEGRGHQGRAGRTGPGWATSQIETHDTHDN
jgi:hypothetical protein